VASALISFPKVSNSSRISINGKCDAVDELGSTKWIWFVLLVFRFDCIMDEVTEATVDPDSEDVDVDQLAAASFETLQGSTSASIGLRAMIADLCSTSFVNYDILQSQYQKGIDDGGLVVIRGVPQVNRQLGVDGITNGRKMRDAIPRV
jgi:hypothetical protein